MYVDLTVFNLAFIECNMSDASECMPLLIMYIYLLTYLRTISNVSAIRFSVSSSINCVKLRLYSYQLMRK